MLHTSILVHTSWVWPGNEAIYMLLRLRVSSSDSPRTGAMGHSDTSGVEEFKVTVARLRDKLRSSEETHRIEIQESKETIANLSSKVENLKIEVANLRRTLPHTLGGSEGVELGDGANIMFTRLDVERNTRTLQGALEKEWLAP